MSNYRRRLIITHNIYELVHSWDKDSVRNGYVVDNVRNVDNVDPVDFLINGSIINDGTYINIAKGSYSVSISPGKQYFNEDFYIDASAIVNDTNTNPHLSTVLLDLGSSQGTANSSAAIGHLYDTDHI
jgi:hypothetical protein